MYIHGYYYNQQGEKISVYILTGGDRSEDIEIGAEDGDISFTDDPVEITSQVNDTFDHLLCYQASVRLLCRNYVPGFFCNSCREAVVNIYRGDDCLFAGYIEPRAFSQGYNEDMDEVDLTCIDSLSALQYSNYRNIGALGVTYAAIKAQATQRTFFDILKEIANDATDGLDILGSGAVRVFYDGSKAIDATSGHRYTIFSDISINELLFLGDEEDDVWTQEDVLTEILKYLGLHIVQDGLVFYIFSWKTLRDSGGSIKFANLLTGVVGYAKREGFANITTDMVSDCDTKIDVSPTYNQLLLTDNVTEMENLVENPLDSNSLTHAFGNYQKYMTEYIAEGEGKKAIQAFGAMINGTGTDWGDASQVDWYLWVKKNPLWKFYVTDSNGKRSDVYGSLVNGVTNQQDILSKYLNHGVGAALVAFGSVEKKNGGSDNSPASAPDMKDYLVIGLNTSATAYYPESGNIWSTIAFGSETKSTYLTDGSKLQAAYPIAEYIGNTAGGTFSPSDDETTNYIQISGKITLNPLMNETGNMKDLQAFTGWDKGSKFWHYTVASRNNGDGRYYAQRFWKAASWKDDVVDDADCNATKQSRGVFPFTNNGPQGLEFNYNDACESKDTVSKVGVLQCMLVIGDKCVVETLPENDGSGDGDPRDFTWQKFKTMDECADIDEWLQQSFAIGFNPKLKDKLIGTEFDIQRNTSYTSGVNVEGTLIPIKKDDHVSGQVRFYILGPINEEWDNVTKRHKTFFRHTKYYNERVCLLEQTSSIMVRDFKVEVLSDNGKVGTVDENKDIVYMSDTKETFVNKKDDLEFKITTALTSEECKKMGVNNSVKLSSPQNVATDNALLTIYDTMSGTTAKPEQLYVDERWTEWHEPRIVLTQNLIDKKTSGGRKTCNFLNLYKVASLGKYFYVQGISRNLTEGTATLTLRERF